MEFYENLPVDFLINFYNEIIKNIKKGILTKNMYYELGLIISVANRRGISIDPPFDFNQVVKEQALKDLLQSKEAEDSLYSA